MFWKLIDKVYIINLRKYSERLKSSIQELIKVKCLNFEVIEAFDGSNHKYHYNNIISKGKANSYSHALAIRKAMQKNFNRIIIMEDDCCFCSNFLSKNYIIEEFIQNHFFDALYFYNLNIKIPYQPTLSKDFQIFQNKKPKFFSSHFYLLNKQIYPFCLTYFSTKVNRSLNHSKEFYPTDGIFWNDKTKVIYGMSTDLVYQNMQKLPSIHYNN